MNDFLKLLRDFIIFIPLGILIFGIFFSLLAVSKENLTLLSLGLLIVFYGLIASLIRQFYKDKLSFLRREDLDGNNYLSRWKKYHLFYYVAQFSLLGVFSYIFFKFISTTEATSVRLPETLIFAPLTFNWQTVAALGTVFSALVALGIALVSFWRSSTQEKLSRIKEAIEKLLIPIRKKLDEFSQSKWDLWSIRNRWHRLDDKKNDFPLQYYTLKNANPELVRKIEAFDQNFSLFDNFREETQAQKMLGESVVTTLKNFISSKSVSITGNAGRLPGDEVVLNSHWSGLVNDGSSHRAAVTLFSLALWKASLSEFISDRNVSIDSLSFSLSDLTFSPPFDVRAADELLKKIEDDLSEHSDFSTIEEYRTKWKELYQQGSSLIKEIEQWYSSI